MGFEINNFHKPIIKETQTVKDGGAGNTGYFEQEEKKKEKSIFKEDNADAFVKDEYDIEEDIDFSISKWIAQIILAIKDWIKKITG